MMNKIAFSTIGYGDGIRQEEDKDFFDEHEGFIKNEENWGV